MSEAKISRTRSPFGKELAKLRIDHDETAGQMSKRLGVHATYLSRLEGGHYPVSMNVALRVREAYGLDLTHMVGSTMGRIVIELEHLSEEDRLLVIDIQERAAQKKLEAEGVTTKSAKVASKAASSPSKTARVEDVDGVDFIDDSELDDLDDLA